MSAHTTHGARHISGVDSVELEQRLAAGGDLLVWVTTSWCEPCRALAPHLDGFAAEYGDRVPVVALDGDESAELRRRFQVAGFPTLILFHDGVRVWQRAAAFERSADQVADLIVPMLDALDSVGGAVPDLCPGPPAARAARTVELPAAGPGVQFELRTAEGRQALGAGAHQLPDGAELLVTLQADHRLSEPVEWSALERLEPGSVDGLDVLGAEVDLTQLAAVPALSRLRQLGAPTGQVRLDAGALSGLPRLQSLNASLSPDSVDPTEIFLDDEWIHLLLRDRPGVRSPGPRRAPLIDAPAREVTDDTFGEATAPGPALVGFVLPRMGDTAGVTALLDAAAAAHSDLRVFAGDADRCPRAAAELGVQGVPAVVLLADGAPVWRTGALEDPAEFAATLAAALDALRSGRGRPGRRRRARPERTLRLPDGPLDFHLALHPDELGMPAAVTISDGGEVTVPDGWTVMADIGTSANSAAPGEELAHFGPDDVDVLYAAVTGDALAAGSSFAGVLARLRGLRVLDLEVVDGLDDAGAFAPVVRGFDDLEVLSMYAYPPDGAPSAPSNLLEALRPALPETVINGRWNALGLPEH
ncbi:hypothetical protein GCM10027062_26310 [Nocardioides hungaricus]